MARDIDCISPLDRRNRHKHQVINQPYFLLHKRLCITHTGQHSIMTSQRERTLADLFFRNKKSSTALLRSILLAVSHQ
jgi:hypothetical protein